MSKADKIREFALTSYIDPARAKGELTVAMRAGDVHKAMGLKESMPAVTSALGANIFQAYAQVRLAQREGPQNGSNLVLTYELL